MADPKNKVGAKKVITPEFRVSFPHVFKPQKPMQVGGEAKYAITMLFPKSTDLSALKKAADLAGVEKWGADKKTWPKNVSTPFKDGDEKEEFAGYENTIYVAARSKTQPGLIDRNKEEIIGEADFYAGCYARASMIAFAYDNGVKRGISFALLNIQKLRDGERFGGRVSADKDFGDDVTESEETGSEQGYF